MKASDLFVKCLEAEGVHYIFGIPGEENLDLLNSIKHSSIQLIVTRHEQAAGFMAATYGRLTGKAGVCLATLGPGATNLITAAAYGQLGAMPMFMITGQKPIKTSKQGHFQIVDMVDMMHPISKYTKQIASAENIPTRIREAFRLAQEERPGVAHIELPEDIAGELTDAEIIEKSVVRRPLAESKAIELAIAMIEQAKRPLLLLGAGANRKFSSRMLHQFVDKLGIPFFSTQMGKGVIDERHPLFLGNAALSAGDFVHRAISHTDLIINVGHDVVEKPPFFMQQGGFKVIHVNYQSAAVDPVYYPQLEVIGDIANSVYQLSEAITPQPHWNFSYFREIRQALVNHCRHGIDDERFPVYPQRLVHDIRAVMPDDGIIALDNGMYKIWFARNYPAYQPNTVLLDNALASMGAGLPSAIAARIVYPEREILAICGDGGFMMNSQEMETAVRLGLDLIVLVLCDRGYGMIKWKQTHMGFDDFGLDFNNPDFVAYAQSYGAHGHRLAAAAELAPLIESCRAEKGVHLIEIPIDYSDNDRILNYEIKQISKFL
jgi:acetolactate synthase-1/2/3 large subunit